MLALSLLQPSPDVTAFLMEMLRKNAVDAPLFVMSVLLVMWLWRQLPSAQPTKAPSKSKTKRTEKGKDGEGGEGDEDDEAAAIVVRVEIPPGEIELAVRAALDERIAQLDARVGEIESWRDAEHKAREIADAEARGRAQALLESGKGDPAAIPLEITPTGPRRRSP